MTAEAIWVWPGLLVACCSWAATILAAVLPAGAGGGGATIIDQWSEVKPPEPPEITKLKVDPKTTGLLILDIERRTTNMERRPRAVASVPRIARLLTRAREAGVFVAYSTTGGAKRSDILPEVKPAEGEPVVASSVDKFYKTDLEKHLVDRGIKTVIVVGTAAEGAVLHTATAAAMRSFEVIVPVDGLSSSTLYAEQYVCWHLVNAPGSRRRTTLTRTDLIEFAEPTQP
ncbi:MAG TPA: isochorismatase family protein [Phycisphaerae bacterium]|nr:isochorismatase family protein [Phycisphaerae bacterium]